MTERSGCYFHKQTGTWRAQVCYKRERWHLGYYPTKVQAHRAYQQALVRLLQDQLDASIRELIVSDEIKDRRFTRRFPLP